MSEVVHQCGDWVVFVDEFERERVGMVVETCVMGKPGLLGLDADCGGTYVRREVEVRSLRDGTGVKGFRRCSRVLNGKPFGVLASVCGTD